MTIDIDDPRRPEVRALLETHLSFCNSHSPPEDVHALDVESLVDPAIAFCTAQIDGVVVATGALKRIDADHGELKSMHTATSVRGRGIGTAMVTHLLEIARGWGLIRVSLETGSMDAFSPARALYARAGFAPCGPFTGYVESPNSAFMTRTL